MERLRRDVEAGWARATGGDLLVGASVGLALSASAIGAATRLGRRGAATALAMPLQLGETCAVAGRRARRRAAG